MLHHRIHRISLHFFSLLIHPASTRKLYEKKLQRLLDDGPAQPPLPQLVLTEIQVNHNGNSESDMYSDKEDGKNSVNTTHNGYMCTATVDVSFTVLENAFAEDKCVIMYCHNGELYGNVV